MSMLRVWVDAACLLGSGLLGPGAKVKLQATLLWRQTRSLRVPRDKKWGLGAGLSQIDSRVACSFDENQQKVCYVREVVVSLQCQSEQTTSERHEIRNNKSNI